MISIWKNIGVLRGLAILLVVYNHSQRSVMFVREHPALAGVPFDALENATVMLAAIIGTIPVPAFMVASGFFMGRFVTTWSAAKANTRTLAIRYALWWIAGYVLQVLQDHAAWRELAVDSLRGFGPFSAYWFLAVLLLALLLSPWLTRWSRTMPKSFVIVAMALELMRAVLYNFQWNAIRVLPLELPFFMLGILSSNFTDGTVKKLGTYRAWIGAASLLALVFVILESSYWWHAAGGPGFRVITDARISGRILGGAFCAWFLLQPVKPQGRISRFLNNVGAKSLGVLLSFEAILMVVVAVLWHLPMLTGAWDPVQKAPPAWMGHGLFAFVLFASSAGGSLAAIWLVEALLGSRWRRAIFG